MITYSESLMDCMSSLIGCNMDELIHYFENTLGDLCVEYVQMYLDDLKDDMLQGSLGMSNHS